MSAKDDREREDQCDRELKAAIARGASEKEQDAILERYDKVEEL